MNRSTILRWEKGETAPRGERALRYLEVLEELARAGTLLVFLFVALAAVFEPDRWYTPTEIWRQSHGARRRCTRRSIAVSSADSDEVAGGLSRGERSWTGSEVTRLAG